MDMFQIIMNLNFLVDLLKAIGPNGKKNKEYLPYYNQITEALKNFEGKWNLG